ncbi:cupin domain-containing protein [Siccirubricoccus sp. G192]|uniref:cupin domain-containing protein n=1 Tax=Siccirubricoccus sp. G192 TaxID=2849651 RepID=UPI001C2C78C5|nr:cupin domain-containing protein [Siccirubricoccus sp. G192]MBV1799419.1 cupin domain-containing protein [Siccirubricoccus sp. G192]
MLSRRSFAACAICAATGLVASRVDAQTQPAQTPGASRRIIQSTDLDEKHVAMLAVVEIPAGATVARHTHPGVESAYVLEGGVEISVQGQPDRQVRAGEGFQIPPGTPHSAKGGDKPSKLSITYVVEKGKPLASPA